MPSLAVPDAKKRRPCAEAPGEMGKMREAAFQLLEAFLPSPTTTGKVCDGLCRLLGPCGLGAPCGVACASELASHRKLPDRLVTIWLIHVQQHCPPRLAAFCRDGVVRAGGLSCG